MPPQGMAPGGGPAKTMMLQSSEGVVSVAATGGSVPVAAADAGGGASTVFWIVSMLVGIGLGALAYVIVLQLQ